MTKKQKKMLCRIIVTAVLVLAIRLFSIGGLPGTLLYLAAYLIIGYDILRKAGKGILRGQVFDENFLMAVATVGAIGLAFYEKSGDFMEAVAVMLFYQIGELFQSYAVGKSRRNITALMDIRPDYANIEQDGQLTQVDPDDVPVGAVIVVQPGEKVPLDGMVLEGTSTLNTAALTGESLPRDVTGGDEIVSGCINMTGVLKIRTTRAFGESTVSKILELVENAAEIGDYLLAELHKIGGLKEVRGRGLMIGIEIDGSGPELRKKLLFDKHIFTGGAGASTVRLLPALCFNVLQRLSQIAVSVFAFLATGGAPERIGTVFSLQCYVVLGSNCIPIPGAMGVSDYIMLSGLGSIGMPPEAAVSLDLLSRSVSFYICIIVCGISIMGKYIYDRKKSKKAA